MYSKSLKMKVLLMSNPQAMISLAFSWANRLVSSGVRSFHKNFSSSVIWMTKGTSNTSCNHLQNKTIATKINVQSIEVTLSWWMELNVLNASLLMMDHDPCTNRMVSFVHKHLISIQDLYNVWRWGILMHFDRWILTDERRRFDDEWNDEQDVEWSFPFFELNHPSNEMNQIELNLKKENSMKLFSNEILWLTNDFVIIDTTHRFCFHFPWIDDVLIFIQIVLIVDSDIGLSVHRWIFNARYRDFGCDELR